MRFSQIIILCLLGLACSAQIDTDRPAFTNSVNIVPKRTLQFEGGIGYGVQVNTLRPLFTNGAYLERLETVSAPQGIFRYGISSQTEIRLKLPQFSFSRTKFSNDSISGYSQDFWNRQVGIGLKQRILDNDKFSLSYLAMLRSERDYFFDSERAITLGLFNDLIWEYRFSEKSKMAGTVGFGNLKDSYQLNGAVLIGSKINDQLWLQVEAVSENYFSENLRRNINYYTLNLSNQYALTERDAIDLTIGSIVHSTIFSNPRNLTIKLGYAHLFNSNK